MRTNRQQLSEDWGCNREGKHKGQTHNGAAKQGQTGAQTKKRKANQHTNTKKGKRKEQNEVNELREVVA